MTVTKKIWLSWPSIRESGQDFQSKWVNIEPEQHNGILEKGEKINTKNPAYIGFIDGPEFSLREFVNFIKDGTLKLEEQDE